MLKIKIIYPYNKATDTKNIINNGSGTKVPELPIEEVEYNEYK